MSFTFYELFWYFVIYAFVGWCWEVCLCTVQTGGFVNRGFLNGPVCPIYGFALVGILLALTPISDNLLFLYVGGVVFATVVELFGGWLLKTLFHTSWWDYSEFPFNFHGYICLGVSLFWGIGVVLIMRVIHPLIAQLVAWIPHLLGVIVLCVVAVLFLCDTIVTVMGLMKMKKHFEAIHEISEALRAGSDALARNLGDSALAGAEKFNDAKEQVADKLTETKTESDARWDMLRADWMSTRHYVADRLLKAFPKMYDVRDENIVKQLREWSNRGDKK